MALAMVRRQRQAAVPANRFCKERGQPRWKMSTIVAAMEQHNRANGSNSGTTTDTNPELFRAGHLERVTGNTWRLFPKPVPS